MRKLAAALGLLGIATVMVSTGVDALSGAGEPARHTITVGQLPLRLSSRTSGVTFSNDALVCPALMITTASGVNASPCSFTIDNAGSTTPDSVTVTMGVSGITAAQVAADKFAVDPKSGQLVFFRTTPQTLYSFTGDQLPVTVDPGLVWGANAGAALDNSDMGTTIVVTYTVVAETVEGATAPPVATPTPVQLVGGVTAVPGRTPTPPPTGSAGAQDGTASTPRFAFLICLVLGLAGLTIAWLQRRRTIAAGRETPRLP